MQVKKNPKVDLTRNSGLYFVIGLAVVLFITWRALEHKSYESELEIVQVFDLQEDLKEDVPITEALKTPPPPPPPSAPEVIEIVQDNDEIEETVIESSEINQETVIEEVMAVDDVEVAEEEEDITVPFAIIENAPVYPGCESMKTNKEKKACFQRMVLQHVKKEFRYPITAQELNIQGKVYVHFVIDGKGFITSIQTRGPDENLEKEASRIVAAMPKMTPGRQRGMAVRVPYSLPINFKLEMD